MNLLKWIFVTLFILIIIVPVAIYGYVQYQHSSLEKETYSYLIDKGYEEQKILSVESKLKKYLCLQLKLYLKMSHMLFMSIKEMILK